jgi:O-antigen/teichoic acid export membrane protein
MVKESKKSTVVRHVFLSGLSNYVGKIVNLGIGFVLTPFILSQLGDSIYGLWALVGSVVAYGFLLDFGITGAVTKYVSEYRTRGEDDLARGLVATALWTNMGLGILVIVSTILLVPVFINIFDILPADHRTATWLFLLAGTAVGINLPCAIATAVLRGLQRFDLINLIGVTATLITAGATALVLLFGGGVVGLAIIGVVVPLLVQLQSIWLINRAGPDLRYGGFGASRSHLKTLISYSSSIFLMNVGGYLESRTDEMVIGGFLPVSSVTPYSLARRLSLLPQMLTEQFLTLLLPMASEIQAQENSARLRSLYIVSTRVTLAILMPISVALVVLAKPLLTVWVGSTYADYSHLVLILVAASLIDTSQWPAGFVLQGIARHQPLAGMTVAAGVSNLILSILLVNQLGLTGVALGTLIPTMVICIGFVTPYAMRIIGVSTAELYTNVVLPSMLPIIPMGIAMIVLQKILQPTSFFLILLVAGVGGIIYGAGYLSLRANELERGILRTIFSEVLSRVKTLSRARERS